MIHTLTKTYYASDKLTISELVEALPSFYGSNDALIKEVSKRLTTMEATLKEAMETIKKTRSLVCSGATVGFNYKLGGDWAYNLYENNANLSATLKTIKNTIKVPI